MGKEHHARMKEIPKLIFDEIAGQTGLDLYSVELSSGLNLKVIFAISAEAVVAWHQVRNQRGTVAFLAVWFYEFNEDFKPEDCNVYQEIPFFQIVAGPFPSGVIDKELGDQLTENVIVQFNQGNYFGFYLVGSFMYFVYSILDVSLAIMEKYEPSHLTYWERFVAPKYDPHVDLGKDGIELP